MARLPNVHIYDDAQSSSIPAHTSWWPCIVVGQLCFFESDLPPDIRQDEELHHLPHRGHLTASGLLLPERHLHPPR